MNKRKYESAFTTQRTQAKWKAAAKSTPPPLIQARFIVSTLWIYVAELHLLEFLHSPTLNFDVVVVCACRLLLPSAPDARGL